MHEMQGDRENARRYFLEYLVQRLGFQTPEQALTALHDIVEKEPGNHMAFIHLGQIYGYLNRAKEAVPLLEKGTHWQLKKSKHYEFRFIEHSDVHSHIDQIVDGWEGRLTRTAALLEIEPDLTIRYYFYQSPVHKEAITGDREPAHFLPSRNEVHMVFYEEHQQNGVHEDTHALLHHIGNPIKLLDEGIALFMQSGHRIHDRFLHHSENAYPLRDLLDNTTFGTKNLFISYPQCGSFAGFLWSRYGIKRLKQACRSTGEELFTQIYGKPLTDLEKEWKDFLNRDAAPS